MRKLHPTPNLFFSLTLLLSLPALPAWATNKKADQVRPTAKTSGSHAKTKEAETARKGKKAVPAAHADTKAATSKQGNAKQVALTSKNQPGKATKENNSKLKACAKCPTQSGQLSAQAKGNAAKAGLKPALLLETTTKKNAAASGKSAANKSTLLSSRLVPASFALAASGESRGKFGKNNANAKHNEEEPEDVPPVKETLPRPRGTTAVKAADASRESSRVIPAKKDRDEDKEVERDEQKRSQRPREVAEKEGEPVYDIAYPDQIEVTEFGSTSSTVQNLLTLPTMRPLTPFGAVVTRSSSTPGKRGDLVIPQQRVLEIQYQLASRGFYNNEPNGIYDEATIQAMWEFQKNYGLPATGYPTAHALKRLGLAN